MNAGLPRAHRLARRREIDLAYREGRRVRGKWLRLHVRLNGLDVSRLAMSVPSRLCNAVERNRWKRVLRECFRLHPEEVGTGLDIIAVPTCPPGTLSRSEVEVVWIDLVRRIRRELGTPPPPPRGPMP